MAQKTKDKSHTGHETLPTALLVLADGTCFPGYGFGVEGKAVGEVCFTTAATGYQETLTDPSFAGQIVTFTFPHIGNVGANADDMERAKPAARGLVVRDPISRADNWRAEEQFDDWVRRSGLIGISGVDTRRLTHLIRQSGAQAGVIAHASDGRFDQSALLKEAQNWPGLEGMELARGVSRTAVEVVETSAAGPHVVALDYGAKDAILRSLQKAEFRVTVVPATASAAEILALKPDGVFLSNGPGDPAATGAYALPTIKDLIAADMPIFGICLGHQLLALALGGETYKMKQGHRGANHPVLEVSSGRVAITSMNHGFSVTAQSLPEDVAVTHTSLFDGTVCGLAHRTKPIFSVQYHPEASPGPRDSLYLFTRFRKLIESRHATTH